MSDLSKEFGELKGKIEEFMEWEKKEHEELRKDVISLKLWRALQTGSIAIVAWLLGKG